VADGVLIGPGPGRQHGAMSERENKALIRWYYDEIPTGRN
jgi:hypothetical protein